MNDFDYDVMQKKRIANQAKHRKCGSKSKKCPMSTDYMTQKQWRERCGEVVTYQLGRPMPWDDFKQLPVHIQKEYLLDLIGRYSATASDIARMFGITSQTVAKFCGKDDINIGFTPGKRMPKDRRNEFEMLFVGHTYEQNEQESEPVEVLSKNSSGECTQNLDINESKPSADMAMTEFSLSFSGKFSREMVLNSLSSMLPTGTNVKFEIRCQMIA